MALLEVVLMTVFMISILLQNRNRWVDSDG